MPTPTINLGYTKQMASKTSFHYADVGAANHQLTDDWISVPNTEFFIHMFEPDPNAAAKLREIQTITRVNNVIHECALGSKEGNLRFHLCKKREVSSAMVPNRNLLNQFPESNRFDVEQIIHVPALTMDTALAGTQIDFLKVDVQGFELEVLRGAMNTLKTVLAVEVEVEFEEMYKDQPLFGEVDFFLKQHGFVFWDFRTIYRYDRRVYPKPSGQALAADAVYLKTPGPKSRDSVYATKVEIISRGLGMLEIADYLT